MTTRRPEFAEYGSGGDYAGARRARRAFRYGVVAVLVFTFGLWMSETYLRFEETERLYLLALTHEPESARVLLRQAIKIDAANRERPTAKYAAALAEREEDERRLTAYQKAYELDPANAFLAMRFGCELFAHKEMRRAHELFLAAYEHDSRNALPLYLEAATLPFIEENNPHLDEAFQSVQRANAEADPLLFQRPLWFSTLPQRGDWYARWRRRIAAELLVPIQTFATFVFTLAEENLAEGYPGDWNARLQAMEAMGVRLANDSEPEASAPQAHAGILLQLRAVQLQKRFREMESQNISELAQRENRLEQALEMVNAFEIAREDRVAAQRTLIRLPLQLIWQGAILLFGIYLATYLAARVLRAGRQSWTLRHRPWARLMVMVGCSLLLMLLTALASIDELHESTPILVSVIDYAWFAIIGLMAGAGTFYPAFMLPLAHQVVRGDDANPENVATSLSYARRARRVAYVSLMRRYYGILLGTFASTACLWVLGFRIVSGLFPWQTKLLAPGLGAEEEAIVGAALRLLG